MTTTAQLNKRLVQQVIATYQQAWETQDPEKILTIFNEDATYQERAFEEPCRGHEGIRRYWQEKVMKRQGNIRFRLLNLYMDTTTAVAEWEVEFNDLPGRRRRRMREVAILEFRGDRIASLREYWDSISIGRCR